MPPIGPPSWWPRWLRWPGSREETGFDPMGRGEGGRMYSQPSAMAALLSRYGPQASALMPVEQSLEGTRGTLLPEKEPTFPASTQLGVPRLPTQQPPPPEPPPVRPPSIGPGLPSTSLVQQVQEARAALEKELESPEPYKAFGVGPGVLPPWLIRKGVAAGVGVSKTGSGRFLEKGWEALTGKPTAAHVVRESTVPVDPLGEVGGTLGATVAEIYGGKAVLGAASRLFHPSTKLAQSLELLSRWSSPSRGQTALIGALEGLPSDIAYWKVNPESGWGVVPFGAGIGAVAGALTPAARTLRRIVPERTYGKADFYMRELWPERGGREAVRGMRPFEPEFAPVSRESIREAREAGGGAPSWPRGQEALSNLENLLKERWHITQANKPGPTRGFGRIAADPLPEAISRAPIEVQEEFSRDLFDQTLPDLVTRFNRVHGGGVGSLLGEGEITVRRNRGRGVYKSEAEPMEIMRAEPNESLEVRGLPANPVAARPIVERLGGWMSLAYGQDAFAAVRRADDGPYLGWLLARQGPGDKILRLTERDVGRLQSLLESASFDLDEGFGWAVNFGKDWGVADADYLADLNRALGQVDPDLVALPTNFHSIYNDVAGLGGTSESYLRSWAQADPKVLGREAKELANLLSRRIAPTYANWGRKLGGGAGSVREIQATAKSLRQLARTRRVYGPKEAGFFDVLTEYGPPKRFAAKTAIGAGVGAGVGYFTSPPEERTEATLRGALAGAAIPHGPAVIRSLRSMPKAGAAFANIGGSGPKFYSRLERAIEASQRGRGTAAEWIAELQKAKGGVSRGELEWAGLERNFPDPAQKITKEEMLEWAQREGYGAFEETRYGTWASGNRPTIPDALRTQAETAAERASTAYHNSLHLDATLQSKADRAAERLMRDDPDEFRSIYRQAFGVDPVEFTVHNHLRGGPVLGRVSPAETNLQVLQDAAEAEWATLSADKLRPYTVELSDFLVNGSHEYGGGMARRQYRAPAAIPGDPQISYEVAPRAVAERLGVVEDYDAVYDAWRLRKETANISADLNHRIDDLRMSGDRPSRWGSSNAYNTPGGTNRREVTLRVPSDPDAPGRPFTSTAHFPGQDFFAHVRVSDHTGPNGEKILFVEEIQSDWGREGREGGFRPRRPYHQWQVEEARREVERARARYEMMVRRYGGRVSENVHVNRPEHIRHPEISSWITPGEGPFRVPPRERRAELPQLEVLEAYKQELADAEDRLSRVLDSGAVPAMPFTVEGNVQLSGWSGLALRRIIAEAVAGGYDQVAIINGIQSAARYRLHNFFDWIEWDPATETLEASLRDGGSRTATGVTYHNLDDYVGDDVAAYLREQTEDVYRFEDSYNEDLQRYEALVAERDRLSEELERGGELWETRSELRTDVEREMMGQGNLFRTSEENLEEMKRALTEAEQEFANAEDRVLQLEEEIEELNAAYGGDIESPDFYGPASVDDYELEHIYNQSGDDSNAHYNLYGYRENDIEGAIPDRIFPKIVKEAGGNPKTDLEWKKLDLGWDEDWEAQGMGENLVLTITPAMKERVLKHGQRLGFMQREIVGGITGAGLGGTAGAMAAPEGEEWKGFGAGAVVGAALGAGAARFARPPEGVEGVKRALSDEELVAVLKGEARPSGEPIVPKKGPTLEEAKLTTEDIIGKTEKFGESIPEDIEGLTRKELLEERRRKGIEGVTNEAIREELHRLAADPRAEKLLEEQAARAFQDVGADFKKPVTHAQLRQEAQVLGLNPEQILETPTRQLTQADMVAIRGIVQRNARRLREIELRLDGRDPANPMQVVNQAMTEGDRQALREEAELLDGQNTALLGKFMQQRTEFGRALNAMKLFSQYTKLPDGTLDQLAWQAKARRMAEESGWGDLTPEVVSKIRQYAEAGDEQGMLNYVAMLRRADLAKQAMTLWKAGLLTNPATHVANLVGNTSMYILEGLKDRPAYILDRMMAKATGVRTKGAPEGIWTSSAKAALDGVSEAKEVLAGRMRPEVSKLDQIMEIDINLEGLPVIGKLLPMKEVEGRRVNVFLDAYQKFIYRALGAGDRIFRKAAYARSLREQANLMAQKTGDAAEYWLAHASDEMHLQAIADAELAIFVNRGALGSIGSTAKRGAWSISPPVGAVAEYAMPFTMTPANIVSRAIEYSGLGLIGGLYDFGRAIVNKGGGKPGKVFALTKSVPTAAAAQRRAADRMGRAMVGIVPVMFGYLGHKAGFLTGEYPTEAAERNLWQTQGTQANSLQFPGYDKYVSLERVSPFGNLIQFGAALSRSMDRGESLAAGVAGGAMSIPRYAITQSFLRGTQQMLDWLTAEETGLGESTRARFMQNVGSGFVPNILRATARVIDPTMREREIEGAPFGNILGGAVASTPFLSKTMPPRRDVFGYERERLVDKGPLARARYAAGQYFSPFTISPDLTARYPENRFLSEVGYAPGNISRMRAEGETMPQFQQRSMEVGAEVLQTVQTLMSDPSFRDLPKEQQQERVRQAISEARSRVNARYRREYRR